MNGLLTGENEQKGHVAEERDDPQKPLLRVCLFGTFQFVWQLPTDTQEIAWESRTSARAVFKLLLCAPGRQATKSLLAGILWPDTDEEKARESLRSACKVLRKVLLAPNGEELLTQRNNGDILVLAEQARVWVDADAFEELVAAASRATSTDTALAQWEQANVLLRGEFLADDYEYEWTKHRLIKKRRQVLWMARSRMVRHLSDEYVKRGNSNLAEEILERHITTFPTDQDSLYRLLSMLEQQACFEQACILYERTKYLLEAAGKQPTKHVRAVYERIQQAVPSHFQVIPSRMENISSSETASAMVGLPHPALAHVATSAISRYGSKASETNLIGMMSLISSLSGTDRSSDNTLDVLRVLSGFEGRQDMSLLSRRQLLELGIAAFISCLAHLDSKHISAIEREELGRALGQSISDGWELFHTVGNAKMLAVSQMQLSLIHQAHALLHPSTRSHLYAGVYSLVGLALHHEDRHEEALQAYHHAHLATVATGDVWHIAQNLLSQANIYLALGRYTEAVQTIEEGYSYLGDADEEHRRTKAHLLGVWADVAITTKDFETAQRKLDAVAALLDQISPNEQFDRANWCQLTGKYAYFTDNYSAAAQWYEQALREGHVQCMIRQTITLMSLLSTYAHIQDRNASLMTVEKAARVIPVLNAPIMNKTVIEALQGLLIVFPHDSRIKVAVSDLLQRLRPTKVLR